MEHVVGKEIMDLPSFDALVFESTEALLSYFKQGYNRGQTQRSENNNRDALETFQHLQKVIIVSKSRGVDSFEIRLKEASLHFAVTECLTILQESPDEIMHEYHQYGAILQEMIERVAMLDGRFAPASEALSEGFTLTDVGSLERFLDVLQETRKGLSVEDISPGVLSILAMFYFFMTKYIEAIQDFYIFSTKHTENAKRCVPLFKQAAQTTMEYLECTEESNLSAYKDYAVRWFGFYDNVIEAKLALYMHHEIGDVKLALSSSDESKLQEIIDSNLQVVNEMRAQIMALELEERDVPDELNQQKNEALRAVEHAMEILVDMYATDALMSLQNYNEAATALYAIIEKSNKLDNPQRVQFKANLNLAKVAKKHLLDFDYNFRDIDDQLIPLSQQEADEVKIEETQRKKTQPYGALLLPFDDDEETQTSHEFLVESPTVLAAESARIGILEASVDQVKYDGYLSTWKLRILGDFKASFDEASRLAPNESGENHVAHKELSLLHARLCLTEGLDQTIPDDDTHQSIISVLDTKNVGTHKGLRRLGATERLVNIAIPTAINNGLQYYRHVAEAMILRAHLGIKRIIFYKRNQAKDKPETQGNDIMDAIFKRTYGDLCNAFNILGELGDASVALKNEINYLYEELTYLQPETTEQVEESQGTKFSVTGRINVVAQKFQQQSWASDFDDMVSSLDVADYREPFEDMLRRRIPCLSHIDFVCYSSEYDEFFKNGIHEQNRYGIGRGHEQIRTLIRFSPKSKIALEVTSKIQLTPTEQNLIQQTLLRFEEHLIERSSR